MAAQACGSLKIELVYAALSSAAYEWGSRELREEHGQRVLARDGIPRFLESFEPLPIVQGLRPARMCEEDPDCGGADGRPSEYLSGLILMQIPLKEMVAVTGALPLRVIAGEAADQGQTLVEFRYRGLYLIEFFLEPATLVEKGIPATLQIASLGDNGAEQASRGFEGASRHQSERFYTSPHLSRQDDLWRRCSYARQRC